MGYEVNWHLHNYYTFFVLYYPAWSDLHVFKCLISSTFYSQPLSTAIWIVSEGLLSGKPTLATTNTQLHTLHFKYQLVYLVTYPSIFIPFIIWFMGAWTRIFSMTVLSQQTGKHYTVHICNLWITVVCKDDTRFYHCSCTPQYLILHDTSIAFRCLNNNVRNIHL